MASAVASLQSISFTAQPALKTPLTPNVNKSARVMSPTNMMTNPNLTIIEVENLLRENVRNKFVDLQQGFQTYDVKSTLSVTKGEFRRVLESFCFPMTSEQFEAILNKVERNPNATVRYCDFLDKFGGGIKASQNVRANTSLGHCGSQRLARAPSRGHSPKEMNADLIEKMVSEKIQKNLKNVIKALRLYDYNRDSHIQRHELRKVLENYCFRMSDQQFDKFYQRYDFHHRGVVNYKDFLMRLGVNPKIPMPAKERDSAQTSMVWQESKPGGVVLRPEDITAGMNMFQIESEFRKKMRENYTSLKKIFMSFDRHLNGFISLGDLKAVVNNFALPMSDQLFGQLMERLGVKASGKISWEYFLDKFQDAQGPGNGQTITIKPAHKFFPIRGTEEVLDLKGLVQMLQNHIVRAYSSFKQAFLQLDKNRDGKISRKELRRVIENFKFRLTDGQFKELMLTLDPQQSNSISYQKFLNLFEEKETKEGHKWLKSDHRYNDQQKPAILAWETVEDLLCEKTALNWTDVSAAVVKIDPHATGYISSKALRKIIEAYALPLSDDHFQNLVNIFGNGTGKIAYQDFFNKLGVTVQPGDLEGLSQQITQENQDTVERLHNEQCDKQYSSVDHAANRTEVMSTDEIVQRLRDRISQATPAFRSTFHKYDRRRRGKISKRVFREVLDSFGFILSDEQFKDLCSQLHFHNGFMAYSDFIENFQDPRLTGPSEALQKINNHHVNKQRGDEYGMSADQAEKKLLVKLRENFEGLRGAFYKFDENHDGMVTKKNFRRMLDSFMIIMADDEFEKLCQKLGIDKSTKIGYVDFMKAFEVLETEEGHKLWTSSHKVNDTQPMRLLDAEQVNEILKTKAHRQWNDIAKAFRTMDCAGNGVITRNELRETLYKFMLPMNKPEFGKLWAMLDVNKKGSLSHQDFLRHMLGDKFAPGDDAGTSHDIVLNSHVHLGELSLEQQLKHQQMTENQANTTSAFTVDQVLQKMKDKIRDVYKDPYTAFCKFDRRQRGYLTVSDIQKILVELKYFVDDDQFYDLLLRLKMDKKSDRLTYEEFLSTFDEGHPNHFGPAPKDHPYPQVENHGLVGEACTEKMKKKIVANLDLVTKAFQSFDGQETGRIHIDNVRSVLDNFCFKMTDAQFKSFASTLKVNSDGVVHFVSMLDAIDGAPLNMMDPHKWVRSMEKLDYTTPEPLSMEEVTEYLRELVTSKYKQIARAFADIDFAKIGVVPRDDFREVIYRFTLRLTKEQFDKLWDSLDVNEFENLDYTQFMKSFLLTDRPPTSNNRPPTPNSVRPYTSQSDMRMSLRSSQSRPFTPLVNAEDVEKIVREKIKGNWKEIKTQCRSMDSEGAGQISQEHVREILRRQNVSLSEDQLRKLLLKYDIQNNMMFCYQDFLKHCMLNADNASTQAQGPYKPLSGLKKASARKQPSEHARTPHTAMGRLRSCVMDHWKEMRREFRNIDRNAIGVVNHDEFRQVLRKFNVNLSEDEFSRALMAHDQGGMINYTEFVRGFLKTAAA